MSGRRRLFVLIAGALVLVLAAVAAVAVLLTRDRVRPVPQGRRGPVLLVPGYGGSTGSLQSLAARLRSVGRDVTVVSLPANAQGDLGEQARTLRTAVAAALQRTHAASVDVVGYSAGGVVARLWVRSYGGRDAARRVVTLGSPHHGTDLATTGASVPGACPTACQQLEPGSDLLNRLNAGDETPSGPLWVSIWTSDDQTVVPPASARLAGATDVVVQDVCAGRQVSHGQLPTDSVVQAIVIAELGTVRPSRIDPADCSSLGG